MGEAIVYSDILSPHCRLIIKDEPVNAPEHYIWNIKFMDEDGEDFGSCSEGIWFDSTAAAIAAGRTYYLMELVRDDE